MASVFKPTYSKIDPETGQRITKKLRKWYVKYRDEDGKWRNTPGFRDKEATRQLAARLQRKVERAKAGLIDPKADRYQTPLAGHIKDFEKSLQAKGNSEVYIAITISRITRICTACRFKKVGHITGSEVQSWLNERFTAGQFGKTSLNHYLTAIKNFCRWMLKDKRIAMNPVDYLSRINTADDIKIVRRALTEKEFAKLIKVANGGKVKLKLDGRSRAMIYLIACYTGYRAREIATATKKCFDFDSQPATMTIQAAYSKRRRLDSQPLKDDIAAILQPWVESLAEGRRLWPGNSYRRAAEMLKSDLQEAKIESVDKAGKVIDFHSLRHTYITSLHRAGAHGKVLQELARHSVGWLTEQYTHVDESEKNQAMSKLPDAPKLL